MSYLDALSPRYRLILCDVWGVIHDGVSLYPGAADRLYEWRRAQRCVCLITNAPRTAQAVERQLTGIGLPRDAYDFVATSGEAGIEALNACARPVGFLGTSDDRTILEERGVQVAMDDDFTDLACTGFVEGRPDPEEYRAQLEYMVERGVKMHCLNPDRVVVRGGRLEACAGALAEIYQQLGGTVAFYGKPHQAIYRHALERAGNPDAKQIVAIGDGAQTDMLGAALMGLDAIFISGGINSGEPLPSDFAVINGVKHWRPVAVVRGLG